MSRQAFLQVDDVHVGKARLQRLLDVDLRAQHVPAHLWHFVQAERSCLHLLVFEQAANQFGARIFRLLALGRLLREAAACAT
jgi:hypothetical protein